MHRFLKSFLVALLFFTAGCGTATTTTDSEPTPTPYADQDFIADLSKALVARWIITDDPKNAHTVADQQTSEYRDYIQNQVIKAELDVLDKYQTAVFEDSKLHQYAISYINALKDDIEAWNYNTTDFQKTKELHESAQNERKKIVTSLVEEYSLSVDEQYQSILNDFLTEAKAINAKEETEAKIQSLIDSIEFEVDEEGSFSDYKKYVAIVENNTGVDFSSFSLDIKLKDADGVTIGNTYAGTSNFANGDKVKLDFTTDEKFETYEIVPSYYYD